MKLQKAVLRRFARCDVVPFDFEVLLPLKYSIRRKLGAFVRDHYATVATHLGDPTQLPGAGQN